ncbi:MAG: [acyl-carrier-protein] S-malonyltransferase [candidate division NC10 bacterium RBG_16_65_8]|nr:MAG: [acyl-carrier-protein] S-malonyltransferase [candidate division NC10 bacterium RBG_16_65_8]
MKRIAFVFPGQGSQSVGMGRDIGETSPRWEEASAALGFDLKRLVFEGPEADLTLTANTQPAVLATSIVALDALAAAGIRGDVVAGHSLGEYSALVAAGAIAFADAVRTVRARGQFMQEAVPAGEGAMAAILGLDRALVAQACDEAKDAGAVQVANLNGPGQTVIAGARAAVKKAADLAKAKGAKRAVLLPVSAPFHSALLAPAAERLAGVLGGIRFRDLAVPLVTNVDADLLTEGARVAETLVRQVTAPVRWEEVVLRLVKEGVTACVEVGPGKVLSGLIRRIVPEVQVLNVEDRASLQATLEALR